METRSRVLLLRHALLLVACSVGLSACTSLRTLWGESSRPVPEAAPPAPPVATPAPRVIDLEVARRPVERTAIEASNVEIGAWYGALAVEDFGTRPAYGLKATYHISQDFFLQGDIGWSSLGKTSYEVLNPGAPPLDIDSDRRLRYYSMSFGYNLLPGEVFLGGQRSMNSALYLIGGLGAADIAQRQKVAINFGAGFRILPTDGLAVSFDVQDRVFSIDLAGENKLTHNIEARIGVTAFF